MLLTLLDLQLLIYFSCIKHQSRLDYYNLHLDVPYCIHTRKKRLFSCFQAHLRLIHNTNKFDYPII